MTATADPEITADAATVAPVEWVTTTEAADVLGVDQSLVRRWAGSGRMPPSLVIPTAGNTSRGGGHSPGRAWPKVMLQRWIDEGRPLPAPKWWKLPKRWTGDKVADHLRCTPANVRKLRQLGQLVPAETAGRAGLYLPDDVRAFARTRRPRANADQHMTRSGSIYHDHFREGVLLITHRHDGDDVDHVHRTYAQDPKAGMRTLVRNNPPRRTKGEHTPLEDLA